MVGNVYVQFRKEEHAENALWNLSGRFYAGRPIISDFSPVTGFREASCRQYEENACNRGGYCNFMHLRIISRGLRRELYERYRRRRSYSCSRSRSRSPRRHRSHGKHGSGRRYDDVRYHRNQRSLRSLSPDEWRLRSRSPAGSHKRSPVSESSEERRARIAQWNGEKDKLQESAEEVDTDIGNSTSQVGNDYKRNDFLNQGFQRQGQYAC